MGEQRLYTAKVGGSSPSLGTDMDDIFDDLREIFLSYLPENLRDRIAKKWLFVFNGSPYDWYPQSEWPVKGQDLSVTERAEYALFDRIKEMRKPGRYSIYRLKRDVELPSSPVNMNEYEEYISREL